MSQQPPSADGSPVDYGSAPQPSHLAGPLGFGTFQESWQSWMSVFSSRDDTLLPVVFDDIWLTLMMSEQSSLRNFPVEEVARELTAALQGSREMTQLKACRTLLQLLDALPHSVHVVKQHVPVLVERLKNTYIADIMEELVKILEKMSAAYAKQIAQKGGLDAVLKTVDFLSTDMVPRATRLVLCCMPWVTAESFSLVRNHLSVLGALLGHSIFICREHACSCLYHLVGVNEHDANALRYIATDTFFHNLNQNIGHWGRGEVFVKLLNMLITMCKRCPDIAVRMLKEGTGDSLCTWPPESDAWNDDSRERPEEYVLMASLIGEMLPRLPTGDLFAIDRVLQKGSGVKVEIAHWYKEESDHSWSECPDTEASFLEDAFLANEEEVILNEGSTVVLSAMQMIDDETGTVRQIHRAAHRTDRPIVYGPDSFRQRAEEQDDPRLTMFVEPDEGTLSLLKRALHIVIHFCASDEVNRHIRFKCLEAVLRIIYHAPSGFLSELFCGTVNESVMTIAIADMLICPDLRVVVRTLQMATILMDKLPDMFEMIFHEYGVMHRIQTLGTSFHTPPAGSRHVGRGSGGRKRRGGSVGRGRSRILEDQAEDRWYGTARRNNTRRSRTYPWQGADQAEWTLGAAGSATTPQSAPADDLAVRTSSPDQESSDAGQNAKAGMSAKDEKIVKAWIVDQAAKFVKKHDVERQTEAHRGSEEHGMGQMVDACASLGDLTRAEGLASLQAIHRLLETDSLTLFEVVSSGLVKALLKFLATRAGVVDRETRLRQFFHVFAHCPLEREAALSETPRDDAAEPLIYLVKQLRDCFVFQQRFQIKVHDIEVKGYKSAIPSGFFVKQQLNCRFVRNPECTSLRQCPGETVQLDPMADVRSMEQYLIRKGYVSMREAGGESSDDEIESDVEEMTETRHHFYQQRLEFGILNKVLPPNKPLIIAVPQCYKGDMWNKILTIWYREAPRRGAASSVFGGKYKERRTCRVSLSPIEDYAMKDYELAYSAFTEDVPISQDCIDTIALLRLLNDLNRLWWELYPVNFIPQAIVPQKDFIASLDEKVARQLMQPLVFITGTPPSWVVQIVHAAPFLFRFETRGLIVCVMTMDLLRARSHLRRILFGQSYTKVPDKTKITVSRSELVNMAAKGLDNLLAKNKSKTTLEVNFEDEMGTGRGPTLEFYSLVSRNLQATDLAMWRGNKIADASVSDPGQQTEYFYSEEGLFPAPLAPSAQGPSVEAARSKFSFMGKFMGKAFMDSRPMDIPLNPAFYLWLSGREDRLTWVNLCDVDPSAVRGLLHVQSLVYRRNLIFTATTSEEQRQAALDELAQDVDLCCFYFELPGTDIELKAGGKHMQVTVNDVGQFFQLMVQRSLVDCVWRQLEALRQGFDRFLPVSSLRLFTPGELKLLFEGEDEETWEVSMLSKACQPKYGFHGASPSIHNLYHVMSGFNSQQQREFLMFVTGSPRLPIGGFYSLHPPMSIGRVDKPSTWLPSSSTCTNYLKLPDYPTLELLRERLTQAMREGSSSFHLS